MDSKRLLIFTSTGLVVICIGVVTAMLFYKEAVAKDVIAFVGPLAGLFGKMLMDAVNFEFGSSRSSQKKDDTIAKINKPKETS